MTKTFHKYQIQTKTRSKLQKKGLSYQLCRKKLVNLQAVSCKRHISNLFIT